MTALEQALTYARRYWQHGHEAESQQALTVLRHAIERGTSLEALLERQREWSLATFGPGPRVKGLLDHLRKELREVEAKPDDLEEWLDVVILGLDGAWRSGHDPEQIVEGLVEKYARNRARTWPDWRTADPDAAIEHVRTAEVLE